MDINADTEVNLMDLEISSISFPLDSPFPHSNKSVNINQVFESTPITIVPPPSFVENVDAASSLSESSSPESPFHYDIILLEQDNIFLKLTKPEKKDIDILEVVEEWIGTYEDNKHEAMVTIIQFLVNASGCLMPVTSEMYESMSHEELIKNIAANYVEDFEVCPLLMSGKPWKKFFKKFCNFFRKLVKQCQNSIIYDDFLMENLISILVGLSQQSGRTFRFTANLAGMKIMTSLVDVAVQVSTTLENTEVQYRAERSLSRSEQSLIRIEKIFETKTRLRENLTEIKKMLIFMFDEIFLFRFRDVMFDIRKVCMNEIGIWMNTFPSFFLEDYYIKYIGWSLYDEVAGVRLNCLKGLLPLFATIDFKDKLSPFVSKYKDRIVAMTLDKNARAAVSAVHLVTSLFKTRREVLTYKDMKSVSMLVYSKYRSVAYAAGEFLNASIFRLDNNDSYIMSRSGKLCSPNTPLIQRLIEFVIKSKLPEETPFVVDSLFGINPMMKDWECMTDLLLEDASGPEELLNDTEKTVLIEIMMYSIKQAATGKSPVYKSSEDDTSAEINTEPVGDEKILKDIENLSQHFIRIFPKLLTNFKADREKLKYLIKIPQYFDLKVYTSSHLEKFLQPLLDNLQHVIENYYETDLLKAGSKTLKYLCTEGTTIFPQCDEIRSTIIDSCVEKYHSNIDDWRNIINDNEVQTKEEIIRIVNILKKISILYLQHNINNKDLWVSLMVEINECRYGLSAKSLPIEGIKYCLSSCMQYLSCELHYTVFANNPLRRTAQANLTHTRLEEFIACCQDIMSMTQHEDLAANACGYICDVCLMFSPHLLLYKKDVLNSLLYNVSAETEKLLKDFVKEYVINAHLNADHDGTKRKTKKLDSRRNVLAAFCRLMIYNIIPIHNGADVFKYFNQCQKCYGDLIKETLSTCWNLNKVDLAMTIVLTLSQMYSKLQEHSQKYDQLDQTTPEYLEIKKLAKRFARIFGPKDSKNQRAITLLHKTGIAFALDGFDDKSFPPVCLPFLDILNEFTSKLLRSEKKFINAFIKESVDSRCKIKGSNPNRSWKPMFKYCKALRTRDDNDTSVSTTSIE